MSRTDSLQEKTSPVSSFFFALLCLSFFVLPWYYGLMRPRHQLAAEALVFTMASLGFLFGFPRRFQRLDFWVLGSAALTLFYVPVSILPYKSFVIFAKFFSIVAFYFFARSVICSWTKIRVLFWAFLACGIFYSVIGLLQWYGYLNKDFWYGPESLASRYINGAHFANFLYFAIFSGLVLLLASQAWWTRAAAGGALTIILWTFLLTRTRSAWLGFGLGLVLFFWYSGFQEQLKSAKAKAAVLLAGAAGAVLFTLKGLPVVLSRFSEIWDGTNPPFYSLIFRANAIRDGLHAIFARPWGWGLGMFVEVMPRYQKVVDRFLPNYAHNEFVQIGVDMGILGIAFFAAFLFFYFRNSVLFFKQTGRPFFERCTGAAFLAIAAALALNSQTDFPVRIFANSLFFAVFLAASAFVFSSGEGKPALNIRFLPRFAASGIVFLFAAFTGALLYAQVSFEKGEYFEKYFKWDRAEQEYKKAIQIAPLEPLYSNALAKLLEKRMAVSSKPEARGQYRKQAIHWYEQTVRHSSFMGYHYLLGRLYESENRIKEAESQFRKALQLAPENGFMISEFGYFALKHLQPAEAVTAFEKCQTVSYKGAGKCDCWNIMKAASGKITRYEDLKRIAGNKPEDHRCLGETLGQLQQWDMAKKELNTALEEALQRDGYERFSVYTRTPIIEFYTTHGRSAEVLEIYRRSLELQPGDTAVLQKMQDLEASLKMNNPL